MEARETDSVLGAKLIDHIADLLMKDDWKDIEAGITPTKIYQKNLTVIISLIIRFCEICAASNKKKKPLFFLKNIYNHSKEIMLKRNYFESKKTQ